MISRKNKRGKARRQGMQLMLSLALAVSGMPLAAGETVVAAGAGDSGSGVSAALEPWDASWIASRGIVRPYYNEGGSGFSSTPSISADGRYVVYESTSDDLTLDEPVYGPDNYFYTQVYRHDRLTGANTLVTVSYDQAGGASGDSRAAMISADGVWVVFESAASDLVELDTNEQTDVFARNMETGVTRRLSLMPTGEEASGSSHAPVISDNGYVLFYSHASNLADHFGTYSGNLYRYNLDMDELQWLQDSAVVWEGATLASLSADGRYAAYVKQEPSGGARWYEHVYRYDFDQPDQPPQLIDKAANGMPGTGDSYDRPAISADGRYVAFVSDSDNLAPGSTYNPQVFIRDTVAGTTVRVGPALDYEGFPMAFSPDGRYLAFNAKLSDYVSGSPAGSGNPAMILYDLTTGLHTVPQIGGKPLTNTRHPFFSAYGQLAYEHGENAKVAYAYSQAPGWPQGSRLAVTIQPDQQIGLTWPQAPGAIGYQVFRSKEASRTERVQVGYTTGTTLSVPMPSFGEEPFYEVYPVGARYNAGPALYGAFDSSNDTSPSWPLGAGLRAENVLPDSFGLRWNAAFDDSGPVSYKVWSVEGGQEIPLLETPFEHAVIDGNLIVPGKTYQLIVRAIEMSGGKMSPASDVLTVALPTPDVKPLLTGAHRGAEFANELAWQAPAAGVSVAAFEIYRKGGADAEFVRRDTLGGGERTYRDGAVTSHTEYVYKVIGKDSGGQTVYESSEAAVATGALAKPTVAHVLSRNADGAIVSGTNITLTVNGLPGKSASAEVGYRTWYDGAGAKLAVPRETSAQVALMENGSMPGRYEGVFAVEEGISRVMSVRGRITDDGGGADSDAALIDLTTTGSLRVRFDLAEPKASKIAAAIALLAAEGKAFDAVSQRTNRQVSLPLAGLSTYEFAGLTGGVPYRLKLEKLVERTGVQIVPGLTQEIVIDMAQASASLTVTVREQGNGQAVGGQAVVLYAGNGDEVRRAYTTWEGQAKFDDVPLEPVTVSLDVAGTWFRPVSGQTLDATLGSNTLSFAPERLQEAHLKGVVRTNDGNPLPNVQVSVQQKLNGQIFTFDSTSDVNGEYWIQAFEGDSTVKVSMWGGQHYRMPEEATQRLEAGETRRDITVEQLEVGALTVQLYANYLDRGLAGPIPFDRMSGSGIQLEVKRLRPDYNIAVGAAVTPVYGFPEETEFEVCIRRFVVYGATDCQIVKMDADNQAAASITVQERARVEAKFTTDGRPANARSTVILYREKEGGWEDLSSAPYDNGYSASLAEAGRYRITIFADYGNPKSVVFDVADGEIKDLGTIDTAAIGRFAAAEESGLTASTPEIVPGAAVQMHGAYRNSLEDAVTDARLTLQIPEGLAYVEGSAAVNGIQAAVEGTGNERQVRLGTIEGQGRGSISYRLQATDALKGDTAMPALLIGYEEAGKSVTETIGTAWLRTPSVSLQVPESIRDGRGLIMSGRAPADAEITVYDDQTPIGSTVVRKGGYWTLQADLAERGTRSFHLLRAEAVRDGHRWSSPETRVLVDPDQPVVTKLVMVQINGTRFEMNPQNGVARFPFVINPVVPVRFEVEFDRPNDVETAEIVFGSNQPAEAVWEADGMFRANIVPGYNAGDVYVNYTVKAPAATGLLTEQELRSLPIGFSDYEQVEAAAGDPEMGYHGRTVMRTSAFEAVVESETETDVEYVPTAAELVDASRPGGRQVFGTQLQSRFEDGELILEITYYTQAQDEQAGPVALGFAPRDQLRNLKVASRGLPKGWLKQKLKQIFKPKDIKKAGEKIRDANDKIQEADETFNDLFDQFMSQVEMQGAFKVRYERLAMLAELAAQCPKTHEIYGQAVMNAIDEMYRSQLSAIIVSVGNNLNPIDDDIMKLFNIDIDGMLEDLYKRLDDQIRMLQDGIVTANSKLCEECKDGKCPPKKPKGKSVKGGSPVYIYDPSGYVYEAVADNRLEGVTATVQHKEDGVWKVWDADWFGQINPQLTGADGRYGWDVPNGEWRVIYEKIGYERVVSHEMTVPPPHFDVNYALVSYAPPEVTGAVARRTADGGTLLELTFGKYIRTTSLTNATVAVSADGRPIAAALEPVDGELANSAVYRLEDGLAAEAELAFTVRSEDVISYAGTGMAADYSGTAIVAESDVQPPSLVSAVAAGSSGREIVLTFSEPVKARTLQSAAGISLTGTAAKISGMTDVPGSDRQAKLLLRGNLGRNEAAKLSIAGSPVEDLVGNKLAPAANVAVAASNGFSSDASLAKLVVNGGAPLSPALSSAVADYTATVPLTGEVKLLVKTSHPDAAIRVAGMPWPDDAAQTIDVSGDRRELTIVVTAPDGVTESYYTLTIVRAKTTDGGPGNGGIGGGVPPLPGSKVVRFIDENEVRGSLRDGVAELQVEPQPQESSWSVQLPLSSLAWLADQEAKLALAGPQARLLLPGAALAADRLAKQLGAAAADIVLTFTVSSVEANGLELSVAAAVAGGRSVGIRDFGGYAARVEWKRDGRIAPGTDVYRATESGRYVYAPTIVRAPDTLVLLTRSPGSFAALVRTAAFDDMAGHWSKADVAVMAGRGIVRGAAPGQFAPERQVTRAEFAALLIRSLGIDDEGLEETASPAAFADAADGWYRDVVAEAVRLGLIQGYEDGTFRPDDPITREEMAILLSRAAAAANQPEPVGADPASDLGRYGDGHLVQAHAREAVARAISAGWLQGAADGEIAPHYRATRAQAAVMLARFLKSLR